MALLKQSVQIYKRRLTLFFIMNKPNKIIFVVISLIAVAALIFLFHKKIPFLAEYIYRNAPWKLYDGQVCDFTNCYTSELNQKYAYYLDMAVKNKNPDYCDQVEGQDGGDYGISKEKAIIYCKGSYAIQTGDVKYCEFVSGEAKIACLREANENFPDRNILSQEKCSEYIKSNVEYSNCLIQLATSKNDENLCHMIKNANYLKDEIRCLFLVARAEARTDSVSVNTKLSNIDSSMQICNSYKFEVNRFECYRDMLEGIHRNNDWIPQVGYTYLDQYCLDNAPYDNGEICLYDDLIISPNINIQVTPKTLSDIGFYNRINMQEKIRQNIINAATNDEILKSKLCRSIQMQTYGNSTLSDGQMRSFAIDKCNLKDYLDMKNL